MTEIATARAPASIGNIGVGYDVMGHAFDALHDTVTARREAAPGVRLGAVTGLVDSLPESIADNACLAAAAAVLDAAGADFGARLDIDKQIPLSAGLGGSGASAVAGAAAANGLLAKPFGIDALLPFALEGERAASGSPAWDNVMPSLIGGLVMAARLDPPLVRVIPAPSGVVSVAVLPEATIETRAARAALAESTPLATAVEHARRIAAFGAGCAMNDLDLVAAGLEDVLIEPQRARLLPAFPAVKAAAMKAGALGCSFSGSGPAMFAWALEDDADAAADAMQAAFDAAGLASRAWRSAINAEGVTVERG
ncbi:homoserine kinase [Marinicauda salina]|uniref:Homoserine kinase n=1 Tax=Marinicauda salina TaxID=2135793 RepID=A0A2U2BVP1_9PROT|nr:homoserine kinase [Marinicauda salina]PWE18060.1 homoserine kinase [Marinicauda salina]